LSPFLFWLVLKLKAVQAQHHRPSDDGLRLPGEGLFDFEQAGFCAFTVIGFFADTTHPPILSSHAGAPAPTHLPGT
jgi:hypothetical protein